MFTWLLYGASEAARNAAATKIQNCWKQHVNNRDVRLAIAAHFDGRRSRKEEKEKAEKAEEEEMRFWTHSRASIKSGGFLII